MSNFEFISYELTPKEKYLGIATIKAYGKIMLRYKIVNTKDGTGTFPAIASYKKDDESYVNAFLIDSRCEEEEVQSLIKRNIKPIAKPAFHPRASAEDLPF